MEIKTEKDEEYPIYPVTLQHDFPAEEALESIVKEEETTIQFVVTEVKEKRPHKCVECGRGFVRPCLLRHHMEIHTNENYVQCPQCPKILKGKEKLKSHLRTHNKTRVQMKPHMCPVCAKIFPHAKGMRSHQRRHGVQQKYECEECGTKFKDNSTRKRHIKSRCRGRRLEEENESLTKFECSYCGMIFWRKEDLCQHFTRHVTKSVPCQHCPRSFPNKMALKSHTDRCHRGLPVEVEGPFSCTVCDLAFQSLGNLTNHIKIHTKEKEFKCKSCDKSYCLKAQLSQHVRTKHREIPLEPCKVCGKILKVTSMRDHMALHSNTLPFSCTVCEKKFRAKRNLDAHMQIHDPDRKIYKCSYCSAELKRKDDLKKHNAMHQISVICKQCFKRFKKPELLLEHLKTCQGTLSSQAQIGPKEQ